HAPVQPDLDHADHLASDCGPHLAYRGGRLPDGVLMVGRRCAQRGQAIVLIAVMLSVVVGMTALAIDGSRAYAVRRDLQAAVDAGALAAADSLQRTLSYTTAERAASTSVGMNLRLYAAPLCSPGYGAPGAGSYTVTCTYSD